MFVLISVKLLRFLSKPVLPGPRSAEERLERRRTLQRQRTSDHCVPSKETSASLGVVPFNDDVKGTDEQRYREREGWRRGNKEQGNGVHPRVLNKGNGQAACYRQNERH